MTGVVLLTLAGLVALSAWADRRLGAHDRLPMQFGLRGQPGWTAPRRIALAFTPLLAALVLALILSLPGPAEEKRSAVLISGPAFIAGHLLHLWLIFRHFR